MPYDSVAVILDPSAVDGAEDPVAFVHDEALRRIQLGKGYEKDEIEFLREDPILKDSCLETARYCHEARFRSDSLSIRHPEQAKDGPGKVHRTIRFTRPNSRGMFGRKVRE